MTAPAFISSLLRNIGGLIYIFWQNALEAKKSKCQTTLIWTVACATSFICSIGILLLGPTPKIKEMPIELAEVEITLPNIDKRIDELKSSGKYIPQNDFVRNGDTLLSLFAKLGIKDNQAFDFIRTHEDAKPLLTPQPGQFFTSGIYEDGVLAYLRLYLEGPHKQDSKTIELTRDGKDLFIRTLAFSFSTKEVVASGTFTKNLRTTAKEMGIPNSIREQLENVWDGAADDPIKALKTGDTLRIVYEKKFADGSFVRDGQLLAVQTVQGSDVKEAFWFDEATTGSFYTLNGQSASQTFMRVPLDVKDVSSEFSPLRRHPITGVIRPHNGTDFRAPSGSRIFAASDGIIKVVGYEARGYGRYIKIDHGLGRMTIYAHMSKFAKGMKKGRRVEKGQVIGYVGMTGLATGPHLHYELLLNGVQINPKTADFPDTENLSNYQLAQLKALAYPYEAKFDELARSESKPIPSELILAAQEAKNKAEKEADKFSSDEEAVKTEGNPDSMFAPQALPMLPEEKLPHDPAEDEPQDTQVDDTSDIDNDSGA